MTGVPVYEAIIHCLTEYTMNAKEPNRCLFFFSLCGNVTIANRMSVVLSSVVLI